MSSGNGASSPESPDNSSSGNSGSVLGYIGITLFVGLAIYFACHYIKSILVRRDEGPTSPLGTPGAVPDADNTRDSRNRGLDIENISLLPTFPYQPIKRKCRNERHEHKEKVSTVECAVCLNELEEGEMVRVLPSCKHYFHVNCIDAWLSKNSSCPMCRAHPEPEKVRMGLVSISPPWRLLQSSSSEGRQFSFRSCLGSPFIRTPSKSPGAPSDSPFQGSWQGSPTVMFTPPRDWRQTPPRARTPEISEIREIP